MSRSSAAGRQGRPAPRLCAQAGLRTLLLERATFPREKVCGDCLNPGCWPVLDRLGVSERILGAAACAARRSRVHRHSRRNRCAFRCRKRARRNRDQAQPLRRGAARSRRRMGRGCASGNRRHRDRAPAGRLHRDERAFAPTRIVVAADGRNSTVARLLGLLPLGAQRSHRPPDARPARAAADIA